jgi:hypothetical protein
LIGQQDGPDAKLNAVGASLKREQYARCAAQGHENLRSQAWRGCPGQLLGWSDSVCGKNMMRREQAVLPVSIFARRLFEQVHETPADCVRRSNFFQPVTLLIDCQFAEMPGDGLNLL